MFVVIFCCILFLYVGLQTMRFMFACSMCVISVFLMMSQSLLTYYFTISQALIELIGTQLADLHDFSIIFFFLR